MEFKKLIKVMGTKDFIIWIILGIIEIIINIPFYIVKGIFFPIWWVYDNIFSDRNVLFSMCYIRPVGKFAGKLEDRVKDYIKEKENVDKNVLG